MTGVACEIEGWGLAEVWADGSRLLQLELPRPASRLPEVRLAGKSSRVGDGFVPDVCRRLEAHFRGERVSWDDIELDVDWCTPFQLAVFEALRGVPYGETVTYGELAALAGHPNAQRAAGSVCARNRFAIVVPCHRVVAAGGLGSYPSFGLAYKRRLLELEGVVL